MKFKILIADDEKDFRDILVTIVKIIFEKEFPSMQLQIQTASNGKEELAIAQNESQDIIITDINMPVMGGKEAVRKIRLFDKSVPILALTALTDTKDVHEIIESGVSNYTSKPLNKKLFTAQIKAFVDFYLKNQFKYNKNAINLVNKEIFKRKTIFAIEKLEDLFEMWEYILEFNIVKEDNIQEILQYMYNFEETMIRKARYNEIILEENLENYYFTLTNINETLITDFLLQYDIDEKIGIEHDFHLITFIVKKVSDIEEAIQESTTSITPSESPIEILKEEIEEARELDLRYSTYEKVSAAELAAELDPSIEDKIENFDEDLELMREYIYNLEECENANPKESLHYIINAFKEFNNVVENIGLFNVINRTFDNFTFFLENLDEAILLDLQKRLLLTTLLKGLIDDFDKWIVSLFLQRNAPDIHYFDASFAENCLEIESIFLEKESNEDDDDSIEFF